MQINDIFEDIKSKFDDFLVHRYVKKMQQTHFGELIETCDYSYIVMPSNFYESISIIHQNEIQSAHWSHQQVTVFTGHVWVDNNNLEHTKEVVYSFMTEFLCKIMQHYPSVDLINLFTDGPTSKFKQSYLFSRLADWKKEFSVKIVWNFFATSHGKGAVDWMGGTVK